MVATIPYAALIEAYYALLEKGNRISQYERQPLSAKRETHAIFVATRHIAKALARCPEVRAENHKGEPWKNIAKFYKKKAKEIAADIDTRPRF